MRSAREARRLDSVDTAVWGSPHGAGRRYFEHFLGWGMRVYRASVEGETAGALVTGYGTSGDLMEVEEIMVLPRFRRGGVGRACLEHARREARRLGHRGIVVEVDIGNRRAIRWYRGRGLAKVGLVMTDNERAWADEERPARRGQ